MRVGDMVPEEVLPRSRCWRKQRWESRERAEAHVAHLRETSRESCRTLEAYACQCGWWHVGHNRRGEQAMQEIQQEVMKALGHGRLLVLLGQGYDLPADYGFRKEVRGVAANTLTPAKIREEVNGAVAAVVTDHIDNRLYLQIQQELRGQKRPYLLRRDQSSLNDTLKQLIAGAGTPPPPEVVVPTPPAEAGTTDAVAEAEPARGTAPKGAVKKLVEEHWAEVGGMLTSEAAKRLMEVAAKQGLTTTRASVEQTVRVVRRRRAVDASAPSAPAVPAEPLSEGEAAQLVADAVEALQAVAGYVVAMTERLARLEKENVTLRDKASAVDALKELVAKM